MKHWLTPSLISVCLFMSFNFIDNCLKFIVYSHFKVGCGIPFYKVNFFHHAYSCSGKSKGEQARARVQSLSKWLLKLTIRLFMCSKSFECLKFWCNLVFCNVGQISESTSGYCFFVFFAMRPKASLLLNLQVLLVSAFLLSAFPSFLPLFQYMYLWTCVLCWVCWVCFFRTFKEKKGKNVYI